MKKQLFRTMTSVLCAAAILMGTASAGLGSGAVAYGASVPKDVQNHWAKSFVVTAIEKKIVSGYDDGTFRPDKAVTRAEFSHMLNAALGNSVTTNISFSDVKSSDWYYSAVQKAVAAGYWPLYRYNPDNENPLTVDSKDPTESYQEFIKGENRYALLMRQFPDAAEQLFEQAEADAAERLAMYKKLAGK